MCLASTEVTSPSSLAMTTIDDERGMSISMPVAMRGASLMSSGTAWRIMLAPIRARLASSCSRKGMSAADTPIICFGLTSA